MNLSELFSQIIKGQITENINKENMPDQEAKKELETPQKQIGTFGNLSHSVTCTNKVDKEDTEDLVDLEKKQLDKQAQIKRY